MEQGDKQKLNEIIAALNEVGHQLDGADRCRGYSPWAAISRQEEEIRRQAGLLSGAFRRAHADLTERLAAAARLHLAWGALKDEIEQALRQPEPAVVAVVPDDPER